MFNDEDAIALAGEAFLGQGISDAGSYGMVQLWNPYGTGKVCYLDRLVLAGSAPVIGDLRFIKAPVGSLFPDHLGNKVIDGQNPTAQIWQANSAPPSDYPYNRPKHEFWTPTGNDDKAYAFRPAIVIPQGRGVAICTANAAKCIASFQWREKVDPQGPVSGPPVPGGGTISTSLSNGSNAFDGNDTTYANDAEETSFYIGKVWAAQTTITRIILKSPSGRSFSGGNPGRTYQWTLETYDGTGWATHSTGTYVEAGYATQSVVDIPVSVAALGHRLRMSESAIAAHRVATMEFL